MIVLSFAEPRDSPNVNSAQSNSQGQKSSGHVLHWAMYLRAVLSYYVADERDLVLIGFEALMQIAEQKSSLPVASLALVLV